MPLGQPPGLDSIRDGTVPISACVSLGPQYVGERSHCGATSAKLEECAPSTLKTFPLNTEAKIA